MGIGDLSRALVKAVLVVLDLVTGVGLDEILDFFVDLSSGFSGVVSSDIEDRLVVAKLDLEEALFAYNTSISA